MAWFRREQTPLPAREQESRVPEGLWIKCSACKEIIYKNDLAQNLSVCPKCAFHFRISARERLEMLFDASAFEEFDQGLTSADPLRFKDTKAYAARLQDGKAKTNCADALIAATGEIEGKRTVVAAMEYGFIGGSMGVVVGEKVTRCIERALQHRCRSCRLVLGRRAHDGGRAVADADGQDLRGAGAARRRAAAVTVRA
jgi:acetyl-CoA carboxylase carboxyl transferase subunit beta